MTRPPPSLAARSVCPIRPRARLCDRQGLTERVHANRTLGSGVISVHPYNGRPMSFETPRAVADALRSVDYLADEGIAGRLPRRPARQADPRRGTGRHRQDPARQVGGRDHRTRLIRLQCYEGLDESKALYEWNYKKQLLRIQAERGDGDDWEDDRGRHLLRGVPAHPPAARGDPRRRARRAADRRGRPGRGRDRGAAARDPLRLPGVDPRAGHDRRPSRSRWCSSRRTTPASCPRRSSAAASTSTSTTPTSSARRRSSLHQGAGHHRAPGRPGRPHRPVDPPARPEEGAVGVRDASTGRARCCCSASRTSTRRRRGDAATSCSSTRADIAKAAKELAPSSPAAGRDVLDILTGFVDELRAAGLPVLMAENLDAMEAVEDIPIGGPGGVQVRRCGPR